MKKLSPLLLIVLTTVALPSNAVEKASLQSSDILCDLLGIGCSIVSPDTGGTGKEPPKQG